MKLLLDTNILIDYYARRKPYFYDVLNLRIAALFGDVELWAAAQSFSDIEYILGKAISIDRLRDMMLQSMDFLKITTPSANDIQEAFKSDWPDLEDFLVARCAERVKADRIITRDTKGFALSSVPVQTPIDFFGWLSREYGISYDEVEF